MREEGGGRGRVGREEEAGRRKGGGGQSINQASKLATNNHESLRRE